LPILDLVAEFRRPYVELRPAAVPGARVHNPNPDPPDVLPRVHASAQTMLVIEAEQFLARLDKHGLGLAIGLDLKEIGATLRNHKPSVVVRVLMKQVRAAWKLRQRQRSDRAILVIAKVRPQHRHHSVKLTN
jgi:hypothetical protein